MALTKAHNRMIEDARVNVKDYGAVGDGTTNDTAAIQAALDTGFDVYFPAGDYLITSALTPRTGGWFGQGDGQRGFVSTLTDNDARIRCSGINDGNAFIATPPRVMKNIWIYGEDKTGLGVAYGAEANFGGASNRFWENIRISHFEKGLKGYNWFSNTWQNIWVDTNVYGIDISPTVTSPDGGYFTSTNWNNVYISDNDDYGLNINVPQGTKTFTGQNIVIERNAGTSGTAQAHLTNVGWNIDGLYLEGSASVDAMRLNSCGLNISSGFINGTNGINLTSNVNSLRLLSVSGTTTNDIIKNIAAAADIVAIDCYLQQDLRSVGDKVSLFNFRSPSLNLNHINKLSIGPESVNNVNATPINYAVSYQKSVTGTVPANGFLRIITDEYNYGIWDTCSNAIVSIRDNQDGLVGQALTATTGATHYFSVDLINTTASPISLSSVVVNIMFIKTDPIVL